MLITSAFPARRIKITKSVNLILRRDKMVIWKVFDEKFEILSDDNKLTIDIDGFPSYIGENNFYKENYIVHGKEEDYRYLDCNIYPIDDDVIVIYSGNPIVRKYGDIVNSNYPIVIYGKESKTTAMVWLQEYMNNNLETIKYFSKGEKDGE